jgi:2-dehydro-3-deoxyphosphogluconate aldolase / (4S)-4-hydroxy-2-oxoglutarate aldolase
MREGERVLGSTLLLAIVRFHEGGDVVGAMDALVQGGVDHLEVTADTPGALAAVEDAARKGRTVGVGTVLSADQVRAAAAAGARFVVSPGLLPEVIDVAHELGLEPMPGVFTATEILAATAAGARVMKLFPASCGGPSYLRVLRGPFPLTPLVPTGGVRPDQIQAYLHAGATAVALGSELVGRSAPRSEKDLERIATRAAHALTAARLADTSAADSAPDSGASGDGERVASRPLPFEHRPESEELKT